MVAKRRLSFDSALPRAKKDMSIMELWACNDAAQAAGTVTAVAQCDDPVTSNTQQNNGNMAAVAPLHRACFRGPAIEGLLQRIRKIITMDGCIMAETVAGSTTLDT